MINVDGCFVILKIIILVIKVFFGGCFFLGFCLVLCCWMWVCLIGCFMGVVCGGWMFGL